MTREQNPNIEILMFAVERLDELADEMVFLGGCATGLLITDDAAPPIRVTRDVDAIVQVVRVQIIINCQKNYGQRVSRRMSAMMHPYVAGLQRISYWM